MVLVAAVLVACSTSSPEEQAENRADRLSCAAAASALDHLLNATTEDIDLRSRERDEYAKWYRRAVLEARKGGPDLARMAADVDEQLVGLEDLTLAELHTSGNVVTAIGEWCESSGTSIIAGEDEYER